MDERIERLIQKAETAIDQNNIDQAEAYRVLAANVNYLRKQEAKALNRTLVD